MFVPSFVGEKIDMMEWEMVQGLRDVSSLRGASSDSQHLAGSLEHL